ncbi:ecto-ADP-ribosyltransferase 5-like [Garra rufa]|uniref:ecto-ADP-ribosyltransferase 5-like n=1 Tax=Garra rufa TaxID=137080 RepID=UPI003CCEE8A4
MLLNIEALLLILTALGQDHTTAVEILNMSLTSVDDQYDGCREEMINLVKTEHLQKERSASAEFNEAWQEGEKRAKKPDYNLTRNHSIAIYVYTKHSCNIFCDFNSATRTEKQKYIEGTFKWYSLHFLLTDAIQILKKTQTTCHSTTYRGTNVTFEKINTNTEIRLGSFTSSSFNMSVARGFGNVSCFEIQTCEGVDITKYSKHQNQKEVLIPPYEIFTVTAVKTKEHDKDLWCETVFVLNSSGEKSFLKCRKDKNLDSNLGASGFQ